MSSEKISPKAKQTALSNVNVKGDRSIEGGITQKIDIHEAPREKLTGIPNNSPLGTGKFVGRNGALKQLHEQLTHGRVAVVVGMGGLGKSELAMRYGQNHEADYGGGVCWINGRTGDMLTQVVQYCQLKLGMMLPEEKVKESLNLGQAMDWYLSNWRAEGPVLMVLDDVISLADCRPLLELLSPRFRVLITTRQPKLNADFYELDLELLSPEDALELLAHLAGQQRIETEQGLAIDLCETLGYLPLGIELVGRHLATNPFVTVAEVSNSLSLESEQLRPQDTYLMANQRGVRAAFELSWQRLDTTAQVLGQVLSLFAPGEIPWELVDRAVAGLEIDETTLRAAKTALVQQSLLQKNDQLTLALHPLIQEFFESRRQAHANREQWQQSYIQGLANYAGEIPYVVVLEQIKQLTPAVPHLTALLQHS
ncbi:MAG: NB-ARC domain-containing protein [Leptolyngbyaceae cyanobacterium]